MTNQGEEWECVHIHNDQVKTLPHLMSEFEEADLRIPIHVLDCFENQHRICVVITSDTDVIVALLYHMPAYQQKGLKELWVRAGVGDTTRYIFPCILCMNDWEGTLQSPTSSTQSYWMRYHKQGWYEKSCLKG